MRFALRLCPAARAVPAWGRGDGQPPSQDPERSERALPAQSEASKYEIQREKG